MDLPLPLSLLVWAVGPIGASPPSSVAKAQLPLVAQGSGFSTGHPHRMLRRWPCLPAASSLGFWSHRPGKLGRWGLVRAAPPRAESTSPGPAGVDLGTVLGLAASWWVTQGLSRSAASLGLLTSPGERVPGGDVRPLRAWALLAHLGLDAGAPFSSLGFPVACPQSLSTALGHGAWGSPGKGHGSFLRKMNSRGRCQHGRDIA